MNISNSKTKTKSVRLILVYLTKGKSWNGSTTPSRGSCLPTCRTIRATLICTPRNWILSPSVLTPSSPSPCLVKAVSSMRAERRCSEICNMGLRTLGDIDGYGCPAKGNAGMLPFALLPAPPRGLLKTRRVYSQQWLIALAQWVFFSFRTIIKSYSCGLTRGGVARGREGLRGGVTAIGGPVYPMTV